MKRVDNGEPSVIVVEAPDANRPFSRMLRDISSSHVEGTVTRFQRNRLVLVFDFSSSVFEVMPCGTICLDKYPVALQRILTSCVELLGERRTASWDPAIEFSCFAINGPSSEPTQAKKRDTIALGELYTEVAASGLKFPASDPQRAFGSQSDTLVPLSNPLLLEKSTNVESLCATISPSLRRYEMYCRSQWNSYGGYPCHVGESLELLCSQFPFSDSYFNSCVLITNVRGARGYDGALLSRMVMYARDVSVSIYGVDCPDWQGPRLTALCRAVRRSDGFLFDESTPIPEVAETLLSRKYPLVMEGSPPTELSVNAMHKENILQNLFSQSTQESKTLSTVALDDPMVPIFSIAEARHAQGWSVWVKANPATVVARKIFQLHRGTLILQYEATCQTQGDGVAVTPQLFCIGPKQLTQQLLSTKSATFRDHQADDDSSSSSGKGRVSVEVKDEMLLRSIKSSARWSLTSDAQLLKLLSIPKALTQTSNQISSLNEVRRALDVHSTSLGMSLDLSIRTLVQQRFILCSADDARQVLSSPKQAIHPMTLLGPALANVGFVACPEPQGRQPMRPSSKASQYIKSHCFVFAGHHKSEGDTFHPVTVVQLFVDSVTESSAIACTSVECRVISFNMRHRDEQACVWEAIRAAIGSISKANVTMKLLEDFESQSVINALLKVIPRKEASFHYSYLVSGSRSLLYGYVVNGLLKAKSLQTYEQAIQLASNSESLPWHHIIMHMINRRVNTVGCVLTHASVSVEGKFFLSCIVTLQDRSKVMEVVTSYERNVVTYTVVGGPWESISEHVAASSKADAIVITCFSTLALGLSECKKEHRHSQGVSSLPLGALCSFACRDNAFAVMHLTAWDQDSWPVLAQRCGYFVQNLSALKGTVAVSRIAPNLRALFIDFTDVSVGVSYLGIGQQLMLVVGPADHRRAPNTMAPPDIPLQIPILFFVVDQKTIELGLEAPADVINFSDAFGEEFCYRPLALSLVELHRTSCSTELQRVISEPSARVLCYEGVCREACHPSGIHEFPSPLNDAFAVAHKNDYLYTRRLDMSYVVRCLARSMSDSTKMSYEDRCSAIRDICFPFGQLFSVPGSDCFYLLDTSQSLLGDNGSPWSIHASDTGIAFEEDRSEDGGEFLELPPYRADEFPCMIAFRLALSYTNDEAEDPQLASKTYAVTVPSTNTSSFVEFMQTMTRLVVHEKVTSRLSFFCTILIRSVPPSMIDVCRGSLRPPRSILVDFTTKEFGHNPLVEVTPAVIRNDTFNENQRAVGVSVPLLSSEVDEYFKSHERPEDMDVYVLPEAISSHTYRFQKEVIRQVSTFSLIASFDTPTFSLLRNAVLDEPTSELASTDLVHHSFPSQLRTRSDFTDFVATIVQPALEQCEPWVADEDSIEHGGLYFGQDFALLEDNLMNFTPMYFTEALQQEKLPLIEVAPSTFLYVPSKTNFARQWCLLRLQDEGGQLVVKQFGFIHPEDREHLHEVSGLSVFKFFTQLMEELQNALSTVAFTVQQQHLLNRLVSSREHLADEDLIPEHWGEQQESVVRGARLVSASFGCSGIRLATFEIPMRLNALQLRYKINTDFAHRAIRNRPGCYLVDRHAGDTFTCSFFRTLFYPPGDSSFSDDPEDFPPSYTDEQFRVRGGKLIIHHYECRPTETSPNAELTLRIISQWFTQVNLMDFFGRVVDADDQKRRGAVATLGDLQLLGLRSDVPTTTFAFKTLAPVSVDVLLRHLRAAGLMELEVEDAEEKQHHIFLQKPKDVTKWMGDRRFSSPPDVLLVAAARLRFLLDDQGCLTGVEAQIAKTKDHLGDDERGNAAVHSFTDCLKKCIADAESGIAFASYLGKGSATSRSISLGEVRKLWVDRWWPMSYKTSPTAPLLRTHRIELKRAVSQNRLVSLIEAITKTAKPLEPYVVSCSSESIHWERFSWPLRELIQEETLIERCDLFVLCGISLKDSNGHLAPIEIDRPSDRRETYDLHAAHFEALPCALLIRLNVVWMDIICYNLRDSSKIMTALRSSAMTVVEECAAMRDVALQHLGFVVPTTITEEQFAATCCGDTRNVSAHSVVDCHDLIFRRSASRNRLKRIGQDHFEALVIGLVARGRLINHRFRIEDAMYVLHCETHLAVNEVRETLDSFVQAGRIVPSDGGMKLSDEEAKKVPHNALIADHFARHRTTAHILLEERNGTTRERVALERVRQLYIAGASDVDLMSAVVELQSFSRLYYYTRVPDFNLRNERNASFPEAYLGFRRPRRSANGIDFEFVVNSILNRYGDYLCRVGGKMRRIGIKPPTDENESTGSRKLDERLACRFGQVIVKDGEDSFEETIFFAPQLIYLVKPIHHPNYPNSLKHCGLIIIELGFELVNYALDFYVVTGGLPPNVVSAEVSMLKLQLAFSSNLYDAAVARLLQSVREKSAVATGGKQFSTISAANLLRYYPVPPRSSRNCIRVFPMDNADGPQSSAASQAQYQEDDGDSLLAFINPTAPFQYNGDNYECGGLVSTSNGKTEMYVMIVRCSTGSSSSNTSGMTAPHLSAFGVRHPHDLAIGDAEWTNAQESYDVGVGLSKYADHIFEQLQKQHTEEAERADASATWQVMRKGGPAAQDISVLKKFRSTFNLRMVNTPLTIAPGGRQNMTGISWFYTFVHVLKPLGCVPGHPSLTITVVTETVEDEDCFAHIYMFKDGDETSLVTAAASEATKSVVGVWVGRKNHRQSAKQLSAPTTSSERTLIHTLHRLLAQAMWGSLPVRSEVKKL